MQARSKHTKLRGIAAILLIISLLVSTTGVHIDYAFCGKKLEHITVLHKSEKKVACCSEKMVDDCCTTQEIVQQASVYDFLVNTSYKISPPTASVLHYFIVDLNQFWAPKRSIHHYKPPPSAIKRQSVFQVFLC
jgi:hypothetical protein